MCSLASVGGRVAWEPMLKHLLDERFWSRFMLLFNSMRREVEGSVGDRSWPWPVLRAVVEWLVWLSDVVLGIDGRTA